MSEIPSDLIDDAKAAGCRFSKLERGDCIDTQTINFTKKQLANFLVLRDARAKSSVVSDGIFEDWWNNSKHGSATLTDLNRMTVSGWGDILKEAYQQGKADASKQAQLIVYEVLDSPRHTWQSVTKEHYDNYANDEGKKRIVYIPLTQSTEVANALEMAAVVTWINCMNYMKKHMIPAMQDTELNKFVSDIRNLITTQPTQSATPSAPIEARQSYADGLEAAVNICESLSDKYHNRRDENEAYSHISGGCDFCADAIKALIPSTQAPKESEG